MNPFRGKHVTIVESTQVPLLRLMVRRFWALETVRLSGISPFVMVIALSAMGSYRHCEADDVQVDMTEREANAIRTCVSANRITLGDLTFRLTTVHEDRGVSEPTTLTMGDARSGRVEIVRMPRFEQTHTILLSSGACRVDDTLANSGRSNAFLFRDQKWTQFDSKKQTAVTRMPEQMPGRPPIDPFECLGYDVRFSIESMLNRDNAKVVGRRPEIGAVEVEVTTDGGQRWNCVLDSTRSYLPVSSKLFMADGSLVYSAMAEYKALEDGPGWMLDQAEVQWFRGPGNEVSTQGDWKQRKQLLVSDVRRPSSAEIQAAFSTELPAGWSRVDLTQPRPERDSGPRSLERPLTSRQEGISRSLLIWLNVIAVAAIAVIWAVRHRTKVT
ncbi:MAG: hypothetical protein ACK5Q5_13910 [Planctomycetaceae bacterium]